ncbi:nuclear transport factor 2 family protein [Nocardia miyunensis]|uniref:nuclear transport factor 2 family protein n=1 Tax=Nocardia miyunensis TaxID=282684 RepID=UPI00082A4DD5|nr:nuclear transport factor 2 family protein [Nocardia miyunensis]
MSITEPTRSSASATIDALRAAGERGDADAVAELLAPDVVFHSPMTTRVTFTGAQEVTALHRDIFAVLDDVVTAEPIVSGDAGTFTFSARVRGAELEAMNLVRCNEFGRITECTVYIRPLPGLATLFATLPPRVSVRRRGPLTGALVAVLTRPLAFVLRTADRCAPAFL